MLKIYTDMLEKDIKYDTNIRMDYEDNFKELCNKEFDIFKKYIALAYELDFVLADCCKQSNEDKELYTRFINLRSIDQFMSSNLLYSKGFVVDAITLVRSALEDLWIIQNFWYTDTYFNSWKNGCEIKPSELRNCSAIDNESKELYKNIYKDLCNISHCRINSIAIMSKTHIRVKQEKVYKDFQFKKDYIVLVSSFYIYLLGVIDAINKKLTNTNINEIKEELKKISIVDELIKGGA